MKHRLKLDLYKRGNREYRYLMHGANPSVRGIIYTKSLFPNGPPSDDELVELRDAMKAGPHGDHPVNAKLEVKEDD